MVDSSRCQLPIRFTGHRSRQPRTLLAVPLRQSPTPDVGGRVQVRVVFVRTAHAAEVRLRRSRAGIDVSARGAGLAGVPGIDRDQPRRLVREHGAQAAPAGFQDGAVEPGLGLHMRAGVLPGAPG